MKEFDITNDGCPVAQPRFTRRPSARMKIECPSGKVYLSTCGLIVVFTAADASKRAIWISLSKWPMLQTIAWSRIRSMCSSVMMSQLPVQVT